jgi:hypothetical protein
MTNNNPNNINKEKMSMNIIATHNGPFHADDALAVAALRTSSRPLTSGWMSVGSTPLKR